MDLRTTADVPTDEERTAVDDLLGEPDSAWDGAAERSSADDHVAFGGYHNAIARRHLLLPALHAVQDAIGWVSPGALNYISRRIPVPPAEAFGVASFYDLIETEERPRFVMRVCDDIACSASGAQTVIDDIETAIGPEETSNGEAMWVRSACLGQCENGSAVFIQRAGEEAVTLAPATITDISAVLSGAIVDLPPPSVSTDEFSMLSKAREMGSTAVLAEVTASGIRGRGGAAFPAGVKWEAVAKSDSDEKYVVCNADESEPGTFKDRHLIDTDPMAVIEGLAICGYAVGATRGYIYIRGEYRCQERVLRAALDEAAHHLPFDIELRRGAGAYVCGEETALFNSIEGHRGQPRQKPPFPTEAGLFGKPTVVNNVETLAAIPGIIRNGGAAHASFGTSESKGTKRFCVSGNVHEPGVYEVEFGATVRELIDMAGGVDGELRAVLTGGAAGSFIGPSGLDVPMTFEDTAAAGITLGSGAIMVFNTGTDTPRIIERIAGFFADESCGLCVPCRVGTHQQVELVRRLASDTATAEDRRNLDAIGWVMRDASVCGLGQTAGNAIESAIRTGLIGGGP